ncbi:MAG: hypothetical protein MUF49_06085 [Oculatellaceae cyanobacterium Prado106]|nr:hypothetical protein [Oculatellaceae cyanobacterium Prado106]
MNFDYSGLDQAILTALTQHNLLVGSSSAALQASQDVLANTFPGSTYEWIY